MAALNSFDVEIRDLEYLRHGDHAFQARAYVPRGPGPFPAAVFVHGGAWVDGDRTSGEDLNIPLASGGVVLLSIDFRVPPFASYPGSVADTHYAIRWLKRHATTLNASPLGVGAVGSSSGGHLALMATMKPDDSRYAALTLAGGGGIDATVPYVVALWPVICPLGRYREFLGRPPHPDRMNAIPNQLKYWITEEAMSEGSPLLALARGERVRKPRLLYVQNPADDLHPRHLMDDFVARYRALPGDIQVELFESTAYDGIRRHPDQPSSRAVMQRIVDFIHAGATAAGYAAPQRA